MGLLAYTDPLQSPLAYLLTKQQREYVADYLNKEIISMESHKIYNENKLEELELEEPKEHITILEQLVRQLITIQHTMNEDTANSVYSDLSFSSLVNKSF